MHMDHMVKTLNIKLLNVGDCMNEMIIVTINVIDKTGFFIPKKVNLPKNLAEMTFGLQKMYKDGIFKYKPHFRKKRDIYQVLVDTTDVNNNIIKQIKKIALDKECDIKIDNCYHWITLSNKKEDINKYFE